MELTSQKTSRILMELRSQIILYNTEEHYSAFDKELLTIIKALEHNSYFQGTGLKTCRTN